MEQPTVTLTVLPEPRKANPSIILRTEGGMMVAFASWQTVIKVMGNDLDGDNMLPYKVSVRVAETINGRN